MSDDASPTPAPATPDGMAWGPLARAAAAVAWVVVAGIGFVTAADFSDRAEGDIFDRPSAPQISQIADEAMVGMIPWVLAAIAVTAIAWAISAASDR